MQCTQHSPALASGEPRAPAPAPERQDKQPEESSFARRNRVDPAQASLPLCDASPHALRLSAAPLPMLSCTSPRSAPRDSARSPCSARSQCSAAPPSLLCTPPAVVCAPRAHQPPLPRPPSRAAAALCASRRPLRITPRSALLTLCSRYLPCRRMARRAAGSERPLTLQCARLAPPSRRSPHLYIVDYGLHVVGANASDGEVHGLVVSLLHERRDVV